MKLNKKNITFKSKQCGALLIELLFVLAIIGTATVAVLNHEKNTAVENEAKHAGVKLATITNALRGYVARNLQTIIGSATITTYTNLNFLKSSGCGGVLPQGYIPCSMDNKFPFYLNTFKVKVGRESVVMGAGSASVAVAKIELGPYIKVSQWDSRRRMDLTGILIAKASETSPVMTSVTNASTFASYDYDKVTTSPTFGLLTAVASTGTNNDEWLRVNGSNQMTGNLNVGGNSVYNAIDVTASGVVTGADVTTTAGRSLRTTLVDKGLGRLTQSSATADVTNGGYAMFGPLNMTGVTCDAGALKIFAHLVAYGNDKVFNGVRMYSVGLELRAQVHTADGWVSPKSVAGSYSYIDYSVRCL